MRRFISAIWTAEPVRVAGALATGWAGLVAFDKASTEFDIPLYAYAAAAFIVPFATGLVRSKVTPTADIK